jgi:phosphate transport system permease protein
LKGIHVALSPSTLTLNDLRGDARRRGKERRMRVLFTVAAAISVVISVLIVVTLVQGAIRFLGAIEIPWLWGSGQEQPSWSTRFDRFDLVTIIVGTIIMSSIAMVVAVPLGLGTAAYLSEYASPRVRRVVKPVIEVLAGIPSVVVGYFALFFIAPDIVDWLFQPAQLKNQVVAGLGIGILVIPIMASVSEDALAAVPGSLREASYGVGGTKVSTVLKVVFPAAISGIVAAFIIATSRAFGETMVATMAGGSDGTGSRTLNPLDPGLSMTAAMTNAAGGTDQTRGGAPFDALFLVGLLLFMITLGLNLIGDRFVRRVRQKY